MFFVCCLCLDSKESIKDPFSAFSHLLSVFEILCIFLFTHFGVPEGCLGRLCTLCMCVDKCAQHSPSWEVKPKGMSFPASLWYPQQETWKHPQTSLAGFLQLSSFQVNSYHLHSGVQIQQHIMTDSSMCWAYINGEDRHTSCSPCLQSG